MTPQLTAVLDAIRTMTGREPRAAGSQKWTFCCPAHDDRHASAVVSQADDGKILLHCSVCPTQSLLGVLGLEWRDLYPDDGGPPTPEPPPTVAALADAKRLPIAHLMSEHIRLRDDPRGVVIPYIDPDTGDEIIRLRVRLAGRGAFRWAAGAHVLAYGMHCLGQWADAADSLVICEGESDCWTLWHHGIEAIGLPGAGTAARALAERSAARLNTYSEIVVIKETPLGESRDRGGEIFPSEVAHRLREIGYSGRIRCVRLPAKDPSALHCRDPQRFRAAWDEAMGSARDWDDEWHCWARPAPRPPPAPTWPAPPGPAAYHGLVGEIVRTIEPHTEADPAALLIQLLAAVGSAMGRSPRFRTDGSYQHTNIYAVLVGESGVGRKGTAWGRVGRDVMREAAPDWWESCIRSGLASGEGLIEAVAARDGETHPDRRCLVVEPEFVRALTVAGREGNILGSIIRDAWDTGDLRTMTVVPRQARGAHISIIGHITPPELRAAVGRIDLVNGFCNRFLWCCIKKSKDLPFGGHLDEADIADLRRRLRARIEDSRRVTDMTWAPETMPIWADYYPRLCAHRRGTYGSVTAREAPQAIRLAMIYALLDGSSRVRPEHLDAALAVLVYCRDSARWIYGDGVGDPAADRLLARLREGSMSKSEINNLFHKSYDQADRAVDLLQAAGLITCEIVAGRGRPSERWSYTGGDVSN